LSGVKRADSASVSGGCCRGAGCLATAGLPSRWRMACGVWSVACGVWLGPGTWSANARRGLPASAARTLALATPSTRSWKTVCPQCGRRLPFEASEAPLRGADLPP
jgi:hypothetical protein